MQILRSSLIFNDGLTIAKQEIKLCYLLDAREKPSQFRLQSFVAQMSCSVLYCFVFLLKYTFATCQVFYLLQEPITRSLHMCCTLESTLSNEELFLEQAFPRKSIVSENVRILPK